MEIILKSLIDTKNLAKKIAPLIKSGDVIELKGDLGAGKTAFARELINILIDDNIEVTSPTFNIVQQYHTKNFTIWHFDLYRLKSEEELIEIGIDEALNNGVSLIEWPEIASRILPEESLIINLSCRKNDERVVRLEGYGKWTQLIEKVSNG